MDLIKSTPRPWRLLVDQSCQKTVIDGEGSLAMKFGRDMTIVDCDPSGLGYACGVRAGMQLRVFRGASSSETDMIVDVNSDLDESAALDKFKQYMDVIKASKRPWTMWLSTDGAERPRAGTSAHAVQNTTRQQAPHSDSGSSSAGTRSHHRVIAAGRDLGGTYWVRAALPSNHTAGRPFLLCLGHSVNPAVVAFPQGAQPGAYWRFQLDRKSGACVACVPEPEPSWGATMAAQVGASTDEAAAAASLAANAQAKARAATIALDPWTLDSWIP